MEKNEDLNRRFIRYIANLIHYNSINYDEKRRTINSRYSLTLDNDKNLESALMMTYDPETILPELKDHITDSLLFQNYSRLPR